MLEVKIVIFFGNPEDPFVAFELRKDVFFVIFTTSYPIIMVGRTARDRF